MATQAAKRARALHPAPAPAPLPDAALVPATHGAPAADPALAPLELSIVIPTLNERGNVDLLLAALALALPRTRWEAIFVDDGSSDGTPERIAELAQADRRVRLIRRMGRRGLSSAVIEGALSSTAPVIAVIDADLQHDEKVLPDLFAAVRDGCDLAVGTRYAQGGSTGAWSKDRAAVSRFATRIAEALLKAPLSDPMSGFFAVRREALLDAAPRLSGVGYKILLDLVVSSPRRLATVERPYMFRNRQAGESKLDAAVALEYLELVAEKTVGRVIPVKFLSFGAVGALGLGVHLAVLSTALGMAHAPFQTAQALAVTAAMTFNFALNNAFTYRDRKLKGWRFLGGLLSFYLVCSVGAAANVGVGSLVHDHHSWWLAGVAGAVVGSVWNFAMGGLVTWRRRK